MGMMMVAALGLHAQVSVGSGGGIASPMVEQFQQAGTIRAVPVARANTGAAGQEPTVTGRPVSGTEERSSTQTLGDGTVIATSESDQFYRDGSGRTRVETLSQNRVVITDPVAGYTVTLDTEAKTAYKTPFSFAPMVLRKLVPEVTGTTSATAIYTTTVRTGDSVATVTTGGPVLAARAGRIGVASQNMKHEDLGLQSQNGVLAAGTRDTLTIPQGQIGNNRDIHSVNERWYSDDLQMLVKTVNSDPRFGDSTYDFTNVSRGEPDPTLFQVPADYKVSQNAYVVSDKKPNQQ
jgi:hypothetical protein